MCKIFIWFWLHVWVWNKLLWDIKSSLHIFIRDAAGHWTAQPRYLYSKVRSLSQITFPCLLRDKPWEEQPTKNLHLPVYREFCWVCTVDVDPLVQYEEWCTETISRPIIKLKTLTSNIPRLGRSEPSASQGQSWALRCAPCQWLPGCHHLIRHRPITDIKSCILVRGNGKKSRAIQLKRWSLCCFMLKLYRQIE